MNLIINNYLLNNVKEKGIVDIIIHYKNLIELHEKKMKINEEIKKEPKKHIKYIYQRFNYYNNLSVINYRNKTMKRCIESSFNFCLFVTEIRRYIITTKENSIITFNYKNEPLPIHVRPLFD